LNCKICIFFTGTVKAFNWIVYCLSPASSILRIRILIRNLGLDLKLSFLQINWVSTNAFSGLRWLPLSLLVFINTLSHQVPVVFGGFTFNSFKQSISVVSFLGLVRDFRSEVHICSVHEGITIVVGYSIHSWCKLDWFLGSLLRCLF
jgi:hypothetical protein